MTVSPDHFERAMKNTLMKVTRVISGAGNLSNTFNKTNDDESFNKTTNFILPSKSLMKENSSDVKNSDNNENQKSDFSYAATALQEMENIRKMELQENVNERMRRIVNVEHHLRKTMQNKLSLMKQKSDIKNKLFIRIEDENVNDNLVTSQRFMEIRRKYSDLKSQSKKEFSDKQGIIFKLNQEEKIRNERLNVIHNIYAYHVKCCEGIFERLKQIKNYCKMEAVTTEVQKIQDLSDNLKCILEKAKSNSMENNDIESCRSLLEQIIFMSENLNNKLDKICAEEIMIEETPELNVEMDEEVIEKTVSQDVPAVIDELDHVISNEYAHPELLSEYIKLEEHLNEISKQAEVFIKNPDYKYFVRRLKIAINTPINALSSVSAAHMQDKYFKISQLLRGNFRHLLSDAPEVPKNIYFSFLIDFLSKQFINQGENLVPAKSEDAFALASLVIAIWIEFPEVKPILVAHFMKKCPYIIPAYWPQYKGQSEKDFYISRGYRYNADDSIEDQSSFLKRMTGIFMLYVAIIVSDARHNQPHPHGLKNAWKWLAAIINLEPRADITATLLHTFLELAGHKLSKFYGTQFWKIIYVLNSVYLTKVEEITSIDFRGPVSRLKDFIENIIHSRQFPKPKGMIPVDFW